MTTAITTTTFDAKVHDFLAQRRIAVAGVSRDNSHHPTGNLIYRRLKSTGHDVAWGAMAAAMPDGLPGPGGKAILPAAYEGYSGGSWSELLRTSPMTAKYMMVLYRTYGIHCVVFGLLGSAIAVTAFRRGDRWAWWMLLVGNTMALVSAMTYDWIVNAIGPFELTEYLGLVVVWGALAVTAPFVPTKRTVRTTG
jgi:hypothetical protein